MPGWLSPDRTAIVQGAGQVLTGDSEGEGQMKTIAQFVKDRITALPDLQDALQKSVFGLLGGIGTHPEDVAHMKRTADRLFGDSYRWSVLGAGASQLRI